MGTPRQARPFHQSCHLGVSTSATRVRGGIHPPGGDDSLLFFVLVITPTGRKLSSSLEALAESVGQATGHCVNGSGPARSARGRNACWDRILVRKDERPRCNSADELYGRANQTTAPADATHGGVLSWPERWSEKSSRLPSEDASKARRRPGRADRSRASVGVVPVVLVACPRLD